MCDIHASADPSWLFFSIIYLCWCFYPVGHCSFLSTIQLFFLIPSINHPCPLVSFYFFLLLCCLFPFISIRNAWALVDSRENVFTALWFPCLLQKEGELEQGSLHSVLGLRQYAKAKLWNITQYRLHESVLTQIKYYRLILLFYKDNRFTAIAI